MNKKLLAHEYTDYQVTICCKNHFQKRNENKMIISVETDHLDFIYTANEKRNYSFRNDLHMKMKKKSIVKWPEQRSFYK